MREYPARVDAAPGFTSMDVTLRVYDDPMEIMLDLWHAIGGDEDIEPTEDDILNSEIVGRVGVNTEVIHTVSDQIQGVNEMGMWGFSDPVEGVISVWFEDGMDSESIMHMLAHELGNIAVHRYGPSAEPGQEDTIEIDGEQIAQPDVFMDLFGWVSRQCLAWCVLIQSQTVGDTGEIEFTFDISETDEPN